MGGCEERIYGTVVCPKPRRLSVLNPSSINDQTRPLRWPANNQPEIGDSRAGAELLDIFLTKGSYGGEKFNSQVASSPPYFCGSPPSRASNPVIQDAQFGCDIVTPPSPRVAAGGCVRMKFGHKPAAVRIEGFDCLSRDRRSCSISAVA